MLLLAWMTSNTAMAQRPIGGTVFDQATHEPLVGASMLVVGTDGRTTTNASGGFTLPAASFGDSLRVSYVGYRTHTVALADSVLRIGLAQETENLQAVVVSASRDVTPRKDVPATINTISSEAIQETNPTQLNQVLNKVPGLVMKDLNNEQHMMAIRQPMTTRPYFLYLEDGLPVAPVGNFNHNQLIEVNMLGIRTVEVVKGPASSIYGSNAIGGAINFITQSPTAVPTARVGYQQSSEGYQRMEFHAGDYMTPKLGISLGGYMAKQRDGWQAYSDFDKLSLSAKAVYHFSTATTLTGYLTSNFLDTQTGGSIDSVGFYGREYAANNNFAYRKVNSLRGHLTLDHYWNEDGKTSFSLYSGKSAIGQNPRYRIKNVDALSATGEENDNRYTNYGTVVQHTQKLRFLQSKVIAGLAANYAPTTYWASFGSIVRDPATGYYTAYNATDSLLADYNTDLYGLGLYAQYEFNPTEPLKVVLGARYDRLSYRYANHLSGEAYSGVPDTTITNAPVSPKVGVTYELNKNSGLYANYSKGFSPPQTSELFFGTKVPRLKPAYFDNTEVGGWTALMDRRLYVDVALYRMVGRNEIVSFILPDNSQENRNAGSTLHQGLELSLTYRPVDDLLIRIGGTRAEHRYMDYDVQERANGEMVSYSGNEMPEAPKVIGNFEATYKPRWAKGLRTAVEWQYIGPWYKDEANTALYDDRTFLLRGASYLNLRVGYRVKGFEVYGNVLNLTDELYANGVTRARWGDTYSAGAPRLFVIGFNYQFAGAQEK